MDHENIDIIIIGHVSNDIMVYEGLEERYLGGGVLYSSIAAARSGARVLAVTRAARADSGKLTAFETNGVELAAGYSDTTTSIRNVYHTADRERRTVSLIAQADPFAACDLPSVSSRIIHLSALVAGEIPDELIEAAAARTSVALDVQGVVRVDEGGQMVFRDWAAKERYLPFIRFLKTDAAEAEILTGSRDRPTAARMLVEMGAAEVMVTHSSEVTVCTLSGTFAAPITSRNLSGRTGRGDSCFGAYLAWRLAHSVEDSLAYAAALVSMKMERPGVYQGCPESVAVRIREDGIMARPVAEAAAP